MLAILSLVTLVFQTDPKPVPVLAPETTAELEIPAHTAFSGLDGGTMTRHQDGSVSDWTDSLNWYGEIRSTGNLIIQLNQLPKAPGGHIRMMVMEMASGKSQSFGLTSEGGESRLQFGPFPIQECGYYRIALLLETPGPRPGIQSITLSGPAANAAHFSLVERRNAASVHLGYPVPEIAKDNVEWFYCEVTPRTDPLWTYYEATGWHRGYFGIQVNSPTERRIIFSVLDAGEEAVSRDKVADNNRVHLLAKGKNVVASDFGNEGTGGHSHLVYDWKLGATYKFLLHAKVERTFTTYSGWFYFPEREAWGLIASFKAPRDGKLPHGLYSFNENFGGANGHLQRICEFHNQWIRTTAGIWVALEEARFTHDATGKENRLDRSAGVNGDRFYLANGGFQVDSNPTAVNKAYDMLKRAPSTLSHPLAADLPEIHNER